MKRIAVFALELLLVVLAVRIGAVIAAEVRIIPKWLLHLPQIDFGAGDMRTVVFAFLAAAAAVFAAARLIAGGGVFETARRTAIEIYALIVAVTIAALYLFLLTPINFSPELLLDASLLAFVLFVAVHLAATFAASRRFGIGALFASIFGLLKSPGVWLVLLFAISPIVVGQRFAADRDFANWVTSLRVAANVGADHGYVVESALGETRFEAPIMAQFADADASTIYVLERGGRLYRADYPSGANKALLVDISDQVGYVEMENGALGFDLHPRFAEDGFDFAYVYYTEYRKDGQTNHLTRFSLRAGDPAKVAASAQSLIRQERGNDGYHNAGSVEFGPDGFLYVAVGEGSMGRCHQRIDCNLVGGVLRLDVDRQGGSVSRPIARQPAEGVTANYFIPLDNPYVGTAGALEEYWAHGLRNPFRIAFDRKTGALWAGDVGSTVWEEVVRIERGGNYQFPFIEGREATNKAAPEPLIGKSTGPVYTYRHTAFLRSVIGGSVYRSDKLPALSGKYLFLDNYSGEIFALPANAVTVDSVETVARTPDVAQRGPTSLIEAPDGAVLVTVMGDNDRATGIVGRLVPAGDAAPVAAPAPAADRKPVDLAAARSLFNVNCARCHGASGMGDGPDSQDLGEFVPNFTDENFHKWRTDEEILAALRGGGMAVGRGSAMPPWEGILTDAEMVAVKDYVRSFRGKAPPAE